MKKTYDNILEWNFQYFSKNIINCIKKSFNFSGRASRHEYAHFFLLLFLVIIIVATYSFFWPLLVYIYLPYISVTIRRLHDFNFSGLWCFHIWILFALTAIVYFDLQFSWINKKILENLNVYTIIIILINFALFSLKKGNYNENKYGQKIYE